jgi:hypothetical protein
LTHNIVAAVSSTVYSNRTPDHFRVAQKALDGKQRTGDGGDAGSASLLEFLFELLFQFMIEFLAWLLFDRRR